jgi:hypothetical protein
MPAPQISNVYKGKRKKISSLLLSEYCSPMSVCELARRFRPRSAFIIATSSLRSEPLAHLLDLGHDLRDPERFGHDIILQ